MAAHLFIPFNGEDNGTEFVDKSESPKIITRYGSTKTVTAESKYYGSSAYFDGSGDYLTAEMGAGFSLTDFTIEMWLRPGTFALVNNANRCPFSFGISSGQGGLLVNSNGTVIFYAGASLLITTVALTLDTWHHLAFSRASGTLRAFVDGQAAGSVSYSTAVSNSTVLIGRSYSSYGDYFGYLQDLRVSDTALYTAPFTPPSALFVQKFIYGTITDRFGNPCQRKVYAVSRPTDATAPQILAHGLSDATTGAYELVIPSAGEITRIVVSEDDDPLLNDLVDRVIPA
jgi:hypothetical protein